MFILLNLSCIFPVFWILCSYLKHVYWGLTDPAYSSQLQVRFLINPLCVRYAKSNVNMAVACTCQKTV